MDATGVLIEIAETCEDAAGAIRKLLRIAGVNGHANGHDALAGNGAVEPMRKLGRQRREALPAPTASRPLNGNAMPGLAGNVLAYMGKHRNGAAVKDVADAVGKSPAYVSQVCSKLMAEGRLVLVQRGTYKLAAE